MRDVWNLQAKFDVRVGSKPSRLLIHPRFRAGFDFLVLRSEAGGAAPVLAAWWEKFQVANEFEQKAMIQHGTASKKNKRKNNYRRRTKANDSGRDNLE